MNGAGVLVTAVATLVVGVVSSVDVWRRKPLRTLRAEQGAHRRPAATPSNEAAILWRSRKNRRSAEIKPSWQIFNEAAGQIAHSES